jgi:hypothetical protein
MAEDPKYKVGDQFVDKEPPQKGIFTILSVSEHPNRHGEWIYFYEVEWYDLEYDHGIIKEKEIRQVFKKLKRKR